jgi:hypothetical protein
VPRTGKPVYQQKKKVFQRGKHQRCTYVAGSNCLLSNDGERRGSCRRGRRSWASHRARCWRTRRSAPRGPRPGWSCSSTPAPPSPPAAPSTNVASQFTHHPSTVDETLPPSHSSQVVLLTMLRKENAFMASTPTAAGSQCTISMTSAPAACRPASWRGRRRS